MIKINNSFPVFIVKNTSHAKAFYTTNFDFHVAFENEWYIHLVTKSGVQVGFMLPDQPTQPEIFHNSHSGTGIIFSIEVDDVDSAYDIAKEKNLDIALDVRSEDWGQRHFCIKDPNGIYLDIVQAIDPTDEYLDGYEEIS